MTQDEKVLNYVKHHPNCTRLNIQYDLNLSLGEVNGILLCHSDKIKVVDQFSFPNEFVLAK